MNSKVVIPVIVIAVGIAVLVGFTLMPDDSGDIIDVVPVVDPVDEEEDVLEMDLMHDADDIFEIYESQVKQIVQDTILMYMDDPENAFETITAQSVALDGPIYPFVTADMTFEIVAHGANPDTVGLFAFDLITTTRSTDEILDDLHTNGSTWIEYTFLNPSSGEDDLKRVWLSLHDGYIFGAGYYAHDEEIRQTVKDAILLYVDDKDNAFDTITSQADTLDSSLYPFVLSSDGTFEVLAHGANPELLGALASGLVTPNPSFDQILVKLNDDDDNDGYNSDGVWVEYIFENPETGTDQSKHAWWYLYDGYVFGSGYYDGDSDGYGDDVPFASYETRVKSIVDDVIALYEEDPENAFDTITSQSSTLDGPLYPFVLSGDGAYTVIAHGSNPAAVGRDIPHVLAVTRTSEAILEDLRANGSTWVKYPYTNPASGVKETKSSWLSLHDGYIFGIGYYSSDSETHKVVRDTILLYIDDKENAFDTITARAETLDSQFYPFVLSSDGTFEILAHGANPDLVGVSSVDLVDPTPPFDQILVELNDDADNDGYNGDGALVEYTFVNPETGTEQTKYTWWYLYDGYIFGSGYYSSDDSAMQKDATKTGFMHDDDYDRHDEIFESYASQAKRVVQDAIGLYGADSDNAFDMINTRSATPNSSLYAVVLSNDDTFEILAHGANPDRVGAPASDSIIASITSDEVLDDLDADGTAWFEYDFVSPVSGVEKTKRVWLSLHDDYIFLSSYSVSDAEIRQTVKDAILLYMGDKDNAFYTITSRAATLDSSLYPFVVSNDETFEILAHGASPGLVGVSATDLVTPNPSFDQVLVELRDDIDGDPTDDGAWVEYIFENPETGTDQSKHSWWYLYDGYVFGSGHYDNGDGDSTLQEDTAKMSSMRGDDDIFVSYKSQVKSTVKDIVQMYIDDKDNAFDAITAQSATLDSSIYPFVISNDDTFEILAHGADPDLVGMSSSDIITTISTADEILGAISADGATWIEYEYVNPVSGKDDTKYAWLFLHDGYIFGSGYYANDDVIRQTVKDAILLYIDDKDNAFDTITAQSATLDSSFFPFVLSDDVTFVILANGAYPDLVGISATDLVTPNPSFDQILVELHDDSDSDPTDDGAWVEYIYENPETGTHQSKHAWWYLYDGYVFGSGHYSGGGGGGGNDSAQEGAEEGTTSKTNLIPGDDTIFESYESQVKRIVQSAVSLYRADSDNAFDIITARSATLDNPIYPFVLSNDDAFVVLANGVNPDLVGVSASDIITTTSTADEILGDLSADGTTWIEYEFVNPISGEDDTKHAWLFLYDGYIFGSGYYASDYVIRQTVRDAILLYMGDKDNAFDTITSQGAALDSSLYPFVLSDDGRFQVVAHGANSDLVGVVASDLITPDPSFYQIFVELSDDSYRDSVHDGAWVEYIFENPETGTDQSKHSWWYLYDGYVFGSGYYSP